MQTIVLGLLLLAVPVACKLRNGNSTTLVKSQSSNGCCSEKLKQEIDAWLMHSEAFLRQSEATLIEIGKSLEPDLAQLPTVERDSLIAQLDAGVHDRISYSLVQKADEGVDTENFPNTVLRRVRDLRLDDKPEEKLRDAYAALSSQYTELCAEIKRILSQANDPSLSLLQRAKAGREVDAMTDKARDILFQIRAKFQAAWLDSYSHAITSYFDRQANQMALNTVSEAIPLPYCTDIYFKVNGAPFMTFENVPQDIVIDVSTFSNSLMSLTVESTNKNGPPVSDSILRPKGVTPYYGNEYLTVVSRGRVSAARGADRLYFEWHHIYPIEYSGSDRTPYYNASQTLVPLNRDGTFNLSGNFKNKLVLLNSGKIAGVYRDRLTFLHNYEYCWSDR